MPNFLNLKTALTMMAVTAATMYAMNQAKRIPALARIIRAEPIRAGNVIPFSGSFTGDSRGTTTA